MQRLPTLCPAHQRSAAQRGWAATCSTPGTRPTWDRVHVQDVRSDGGIVKKTLVETSDWNKPNAEARVVLRYTASLPDGTVFDERGEGNELTFAADEGRPPRGCTPAHAPVWVARASRGLCAVGRLQVCVCRRGVGSLDTACQPARRPCLRSELACVSHDCLPVPGAGPMWGLNSAHECMAAGAPAAACGRPCLHACPAASGRSAAQVLHGQPEGTGRADTAVPLAPGTRWPAVQMR